MTDGSSDDERRLLLLHRDGDPGAFVRLVAKYRRPVFSYLVRCGVPVADRDDLFQEVFLRVHAAAAQYQDHRPLHPWLFTVVANAVRMLTNGVALAGTLLAWAGAGLVVFGRRRLAGACMIGVGGTTLAIAIVLAAGATLPLVLSIAAALTLAAIQAKRLLPARRGIEYRAGGPA